MNQLVPQTGPPPYASRTDLGILIVFANSQRDTVLSPVGKPSELAFINAFMPLKLAARPFIPGT